MNLKRSMPCKDLSGLSESTASYKMHKISGSDSSCCSTSSESESESDSSCGSLNDLMYKRPRLMCMPEVCFISTPATAALEASLPFDDLEDDDEFLNFDAILSAGKIHHMDNNDMSSLTRVTCQFSRLSTTAQSA
ncbi:hypothetical protein MPSEU_000100800 [Mayamaea pseudoterrestris]|nr:hypothetical protein MPSEU_000100800 [Mayamaea pseudoterrestris]